MSPVFGHGRLRLYLLKLLDESPRHGYDVIRILGDRFLGVYAPSAGTVYPRLARLEEEGLVTHDKEGGRKVYRLTDAGRAELRARLDELAELEQEIEHSVRDVAREVRQDIRDSVRGLREDLKQATRDVRSNSGRRGSAAPGPARGPGRDPWHHTASRTGRNDDARTGRGDDTRGGRDDDTRTGRGENGRPAGDGEGAREDAGACWDSAGAWRDSIAAWRAAWEDVQSTWRSPRPTGGTHQRPTDGTHPWPTGGTHQELDDLLQWFGESAREAAAEGHLDEDALRACRAVLDDALTTLRATLGARRTR